MSDPTPRGTLGTVHNAALLLELLGTGPRRQQITDLAERSGMSLATLHRLLRSLAAAGLVEQDQRSSRYGLGPELLRLAEQYRARQPVLQTASPFLVELRARTRGTVALSVLVDTDVVEIDHIDGDDVGGIFRDANRVTPALNSAAGRVLIGTADDEVFKRAVALATDDGWEERRQAWREADHVYVPAANAMASPDVAAPLIDEEGATVAAVSVRGPEDVTTLEVLEKQVLPHLLRTCSAISRALGHA